MGRICYIKGNIFDSSADAIVNTVNTDGVMGKGIAKEFKDRYPDMYTKYKEKCVDGSLDIGKIMIYRGNNRKIILFPTKKHWRAPSRIEYIEMGLRKIVSDCDKLQVSSIAFPKLGCGNGGLSWDDVRRLMEKYLSDIPIVSYIYVGNGRPMRQIKSSTTEIEKWINGTDSLLGYSKIKAEVGISIDDLKIVDNWSDDHDRNMCALWDWIRANGAFIERDIPEEYHPYREYMIDKLYNAGYLERIDISPAIKGDLQFEKGYQYLGDSI